MQRPGPSSRVRVSIPGAATVGETYILTATLNPEVAFRNVTSQKVLNVQRVNAGLRITRPQNGDTVRPGETITVETALNQEAIGVVPSIGVTLREGAGVFIQDAARTINNPGTSSRTTTHIPDTLRPGTELVLGAIVAAPGRDISAFCDNRQDEKRLRVGKVPAGLQVTNPRDGSNVQPGQDLNVSVSLNKSAPRHVERITVSLLKNDSSVAEAQIQRPGMMSQATLRMPGGIRPGDRLKIRAVAEPNGILEGFQSESRVTVEKPKANLKISAPRDNERIRKGKDSLDLSISMDRSCVSVAESLVIAVMSGTRVIAEKRMPRPQADTRVTVNLPRDLKSGAYQIKATLLPEADITLGSDSINIMIE